MDFTGFKKSIICRIQLYMGNEYEIAEHDVVKNNGVKLTGITARKKGTNTFPTIYIDDYFDSTLNDTDVDYLALKLSRTLSKAEIPVNISLDGFLSYESARDRLYIKLINAEKNKELLLDVPYKRFHDLAAVFYYAMDEKAFEGRASILVKNSHMENWNITPEDIYSDALNSSQFLNPLKLYTMRELVKELYGRDIMDEDIPMYVLTNRDKLNGAASILYPDALKRISRELSSDLYLLPSSVHEMIIIPRDGNVNEKQLLSMVTEINRCEVSAEEVLSDSVYGYSGETDEISWIC